MDYWQKQTKDKPLFPDLIWSRPENRSSAGKLAIIGGNAYGFAAVAEAYQAANKSGIGTARVLLPDSIRKVVGPVLAEGEFAPSNPSGSFSQKALVDVLDLANWADGVLIAGDLGRNSETAILLESFVTKFRGAVTITKDAVDYFTTNPKPILKRPDTTLVLSLAQLQKLAQTARFPQPVTFRMDMLKLIEALHDFTERHELEIVVKHLDNIFVAVRGRVSTTPVVSAESATTGQARLMEIWRVKTASRAAVWRLQNPSKPFEALTTSLIS